MQIKFFKKEFDEGKANREFPIGPPLVWQFVDKEPKTLTEIIEPILTSKGISMRNPPHMRLEDIINQLAELVEKGYVGAKLYGLEMVECGWCGGTGKQSGEACLSCEGDGKIASTGIQPEEGYERCGDVPSYVPLDPNDSEPLEAIDLDDL